MRRRPSSKFIAFSTAFIAVVTACTLRSNYSTSEDDPRDRFKVTYSHWTDGLVDGNQFENMQGQIVRSHPQNTSLHVARWDDNKATFQPVGVMPPGETKLSDSSLKSGQSYRYQLQEKDAAGRTVINTDLELIIPSDHLIVDRQYYFGAAAETRLGYFVVPDETRLLGHPEENPSSPQAAFFNADYGHFYGKAFLQSDSRAYGKFQERELTPIPLILSFKEVTGYFSFDPRLYRMSNNQLSTYAYQDLLFTTETTERFRFELHLGRNNTPTNFESLASGFVRFDSGNTTQVLCQDKLTPADRILGFFRSEEQLLWFSPTSGEGYLTHFDLNDRFTVAPSKRLLSRYRCDTLPRTRPASPAQSRVLRLQSQILELDRVYARRGVRIDLGALTCKDAAYSEQQVAFAEELSKRPAAFLTALRALGIRKILLDCLPYDGLYLGDQTLFVGAESREPVTQLNRLEKGLWEKRELPTQYFKARMRSTQR